MGSEIDERDVDTRTREKGEKAPYPSPWTLCSNIVKKNQMKEALEMLSKVAFAFIAIFLGGHAFRSVLSAQSSSCESPCVPGTESIMSQKAHGTSATPVQSDLRWNCDWNTADRICNFNRKCVCGEDLLRSDTPFTHFCSALYGN